MKLVLMSCLSESVGLSHYTYHQSTAKKISQVCSDPLLRLLLLRLTILLLKRGIKLHDITGTCAGICVPNPIDAFYSMHLNGQVSEF